MDSIYINFLSVGVFIILVTPIFTILFLKYTEFLPRKVFIFSAFAIGVGISNILLYTDIRICSIFWLPFLLAGLTSRVYLIISK